MSGYGRQSSYKFVNTNFPGPLWTDFPDIITIGVSYEALRMYTCNYKLHASQFLNTWILFLTHHSTSSLSILYIPQKIFKVHFPIVWKTNFHSQEYRLLPIGKPWYHIFGFLKIPKLRNIEHFLDWETKIPNAGNCKFSQPLIVP